MIKIFALLLLLPTLAWAGPEMLMMLTNGMGTVSGGCSASPFLTQDTYDTGGSIGYSAAYYAAGVVNTSATPLSVCAIEIYARENGALTGKTLYVERWSTNVDNSLNVKLQDVTSIDATLLAGTIGYYKINFPSTVSLAQDQSLVFTMREETGTTNYITVAYKASGALGDGSTVADQMYVIYSSTGTGTINSSHFDLRAKWYGE
jgi:hypothetical protein